MCSTFTLKPNNCLYQFTQIQTAAPYQRHRPRKPASRQTPGYFAILPRFRQPIVRQLHTAHFLYLKPNEWNYFTISCILHCYEIEDFPRGCDWIGSRQWIGFPADAVFRTMTHLIFIHIKASNITRNLRGIVSVNISVTTCNQALVQ